MGIDRERRSERSLPTPGAVLTLVRNGRASTRAELQELTGMSRTAVNSRVDILMESDLLLNGDQLASTGGRPPGSLVFHRGAALVLAAAIGRSRCQLAVLDLSGTELASSSLDYEVSAGPDIVLPMVVDQLASLLTSVGSGRPLLGIGLSLPGTVDPEAGVTVDSPVMTGWDGVALRPYLARLGDDVPLFLGNDADVLALSERLGPAEKLSDVLVVKASTGLGLGILSGGRIVTGGLGGAGEIGHTKVDAAQGLLCRCGDVGCLETIAAGWALVARLAEAGRPVDHVRDLMALVQAGDPDAKQLLRESGRRLGELLAVAINLLNPQAVILGGDMAAAFDVYAAGVRETVYTRATALATRDLQFLPATFGDRAGIVGCAVLALDHVLSPAWVDARLVRRD